MEGKVCAGLLGDAAGGCSRLGLGLWLGLSWALGWGWAVAGGNCGLVTKTRNFYLFREGLGFSFWV